jgi:hypothetical protein
MRRRSRRPMTASPKGSTIAKKEDIKRRQGEATKWATEQFFEARQEFRMHQGTLAGIKDEANKKFEPDEEDGVIENTSAAEPNRTDPMGV